MAWRWPELAGDEPAVSPTRRHGVEREHEVAGGREREGVLTEAREGGIWGPPRQRGLGLGGFRAAARRRSGEPRLKKGAIRALGS